MRRVHLALVVAGVLLAVAMPPAGVWPLAAALLVPWVFIARSASPREAFGHGAAFAFGFFALYIAWLPRSFAAPSLLGPSFWAFHPLLLLALMAFWGSTAAAARALAGRGRATLWLLPPTWVGVEHLRSLGYIAFPWGSLGYLWIDTPVGQLAEYLGVTGLSLATVLLASLLAVPFVARRTAAVGGGLTRFLPPALALVALGCGWWWGGTLLREHAWPTDRSALLVQGNIDPFGRAATRALELEAHLELTRTGAAPLPTPPDLVVWPEGALTGGLLEGSRGGELLARIQATAPASHFVIGGQGIAVGGPSNAAFTFGDGQLLGRYDKFMLVPFGERWPLLDSAPWLYRAIFGLFGLPLLVNTVPGPGPDVLPTADATLGVGICYESVFPLVSAAMVRQGAQVLVIITNDAWFAAGNGARQHFDMGRMRAIETRRWLLRAGNDGITAVVDPSGRSVLELPRMVAGSLAVPYGLRDGLTFYAQHADRLPLAILLWGLVTLLAVRIGPRRG
jgi:apolipoprotein N-acyltransferase